MTFITFALIAVAFCDLCSAAFLASRHKPEGDVVPPITTPDQHTPVYLVISSFQDGTRCARTLGFALEKAAFPNRVRVRVMQAADQGDASCEDLFKLNHLKQFCASRAPTATDSCEADVMNRTQFWTIPKSMGRGATHQRGLLSEKIHEHRPEADAFCMTIDSHMDFIHDWDVRATEQWTKTGNEFAVFTGYPGSMGPNQESRPDIHVQTCGYYLNGNMPRGNTPEGVLTRPGQMPYVTMNWAAGFSFHRCHADWNVPVDKHLEMIFDGEEISRAVRLWTSGYDMYHDLVNLIYHDFENATQAFWGHLPSDWNGNSGPAARSSEYRLDRLLRNPNIPDAEPAYDFGVYGLGNQRNIEQYVEWSHVSLGQAWEGFMKDKNLLSKPNCGYLPRVPIRSEQDLKASVGVRPAEVL